MTEAALRVLDLEGLELKGRVNVPDETLLAHVQQSIRRGHPQVWRQPANRDRVALVGGGPSLAQTERELVDLVHVGAKLVTTNGAYHWCLERNLKPSAQIVLDARASNARFVQPDVPGCRYYLASQCHPDLWEAVAARPFVGIFHAIDPETDAEMRQVLDAYYLGHWHGVGGGTTVGSRAIGLLRMLGYLRFDLFGIDSCWMGDQHHAFDQPENDGERRYRVRVTPSAGGDSREFWCSGTHLKQLEDFLQFIRVSGQHFVLHVHGDGLLAYAIRESASIAIDGEV